MMPLVSIITPFLDQEPFIDACVRSVLAQTYPHWELLLIDDGSMDASPAIARSYVDRYPGKIRLLQHEGEGHRGVSASRNLGLRHAAGAFIALLDADDLWLPDKLRVEVQILESQPAAGMLYGPTRWWFEDGSRPAFVEHLGITPDRQYAPPELLSRLILRKQGAIPCTCGVLIRRSAVDAIGGFEEGFRLYEDQIFWAKLFLDFPVYVSSRCFAAYRQHGRSTSSIAEQTGEYHLLRPHSAHRRFLEWLQNDLRERGLEDRGLWRDLEAALWPYQHPLLSRLSGSGRPVLAPIRRLARKARLLSRSTPGR